MREKSIDSIYAPTDLDLAWSAGILDGEGCICISTRKNSNNVLGRSLHQFGVDVVNTDIRIPKRLLDLFGGRINKFNGPGLRRKEAWRWNVYQRQAAGALELMLPYLVSKREQAEVALEFIATMTPQGGSRHRRLDPEIVTRRQQMAQRLRVLKGREEVA